METPKPAVSMMVVEDEAISRKEEAGRIFLMSHRSDPIVSDINAYLKNQGEAANIHWQAQQITRELRSELMGQHPCVIWLTGLSGSGKSTIADALELKLVELGKHTMLLDGDNIRHGLNKDLGFAEADRVENIRRIGEVAKLMTDAGLIVITAFISPYRADRDMVRQLLPEGDFIEVYLNTSLEECERRDVKGLYKKARLGQLPNFTGISAPYEPPASAELVIDTASTGVEHAVDSILHLLGAPE